MSVHKHRAALSVLALAGALVLAGCGGSDDGGSSSAPEVSGQPSTATSSPEATSGQTGEATPSSTGSPATESPSAPASATASEPTTATESDSVSEPPAAAEPTGTASPSSSEPSHPAAGEQPGGSVASVEACRATDLSGAVSPQQGAAGSVILDLTLTNDGDQACELSGYPGVSFADASGEIIGVPATRSGTSGSAVTVLPGESATAQLKQSNARNHGQVCNPHTTAALVVYPPESYTSLSIPYETQACGNPKIAQLEVQGFGV